MLTETQMRAAELFVYKDVLKIKVEDIAKECDVSVSTLYAWKREKEFIRFQTILAEERMEEFLSTAYEEIRELAMSGKESTRLKALELVLKNRGRLKDKQEVNVEITQKSNEELESEIEEMLNRTNL